MAADLRQRVNVGAMSIAEIRSQLTTDDSLVFHVVPGAVERFIAAQEGRRPPMASVGTRASFTADEERLMLIHLGQTLVTALDAQTMQVRLPTLMLVTMAP